MVHTLLLGDLGCSYFLTPGVYLNLLTSADTMRLTRRLFCTLAETPPTCFFDGLTLDIPIQRIVFWCNVCFIHSLGHLWLD